MMRLNYLLIALITLTSLCLNIPGFAQIESNSNISNTTDILDELASGNKSEVKFAIKLDSSPVGYPERRLLSEKNLPVRMYGFCREFARILENRLNDTYRRGYSKKIEVKLTSFEHPVNEKRFDRIRTGEYHIECGSSSVINNVQGILFSKPFLSTGMRLLVINKGQEIELKDLNEGKIRIGYVKNTTTENTLKNAIQVPDDQLIAYDNKEEIISELMRGKNIDAFASDGVLLAAALSNLKKSNLDFSRILTVFPRSKKQPLSIEKYAMVINQNSPRFKQYIDDTLESQEAQNAKQYLDNYEQNNLGLEDTPGASQFGKNK
ncbi:MAG: hypothetical protein ACR9NN_24865 [Nostochopsis sp.]